MVTVVRRHQRMHGLKGSDVQQPARGVPRGDLSGTRNFRVVLEI